MLKTFSIYTQCPHCGVYDRDPVWCDLCGKPKEQAGKKAGIEGVTHQMLRRTCFHVHGAAHYRE